MGVFDFWGMIFMIEKWSVLLRNYKHFHGTSIELPCLSYGSITDSLRIPLLAFRIFGDRRPLHASRLCGQDRPVHLQKGKGWDDGTMGMMISVENTLW
jgi:hypothetical protein